MNPARVAAAGPEAPEAADPVHAVGVGPGDRSYLTERAGRLLEAADVVVGFDSVTERVAARTGGDVLSCGYDDQAAVLERFAGRVEDGERGVAVMWGDPNVSGYQFLGRLEGVLERPVRVVPGVSSVQVAASRARTPLERSTLATLHRRGDVTPALDRLAAAAGERHLLVVVRPYDWMPPAVAAALLERGASPDLEALVLEDLTFPGESIARSSLGDLADADRTGGDYSDLTVLVVRAPRAR